MRLVLASANADKAIEIQQLLAAALGDDLVLVPRPDWVGEVDETGEDFLTNARLKAEALVAATGMAAVADDSGLEVDALGGAPGVHSARYAGPGATYADNIAKLLAELSASEQRSARFHTVALVRFPDGREVVAEGSVEGAVTEAPRGEGGFGYDPIFVPEGGDGRTFGELSPSEKHAVSARGRAFRALAAALSAR